MLFNHLAAAIAALATTIAAAPWDRTWGGYIPVVPPDCRIAHCFFRSNEAIRVAQVDAWLREFCMGAVYPVSEIKYTIPGTDAAQNFDGSVIVVPADWGDMFRFKFDCRGVKCADWVAHIHDPGHCIDGTTDLDKPDCKVTKRHSFGFSIRDWERYTANNTAS